MLKFLEFSISYNYKYFEVQLPFEYVVVLVTTVDCIELVEYSSLFSCSYNLCIYHNNLQVYY